MINTTVGGATKPRDWLVRNAFGYSELKADELKVIADFCMLWSFFEARVLDSFANIKKVTDAVDNISQPSRILEGCCKDAFTHFHDRYTYEDRFNDKFEALNFRQGDRREFVEDVLVNRVDDPALILKALLIIIYRLRNNLLHGEKWAYGIKSQEENFRQANNVLMEVMNLHQN